MSCPLSTAIGTLPGGRALLATGRDDGTVRLWDPVALLRDACGQYRDWAELRENERRASKMLDVLEFKLPADPLEQLTIDELRWTNEELRAESLRRIRIIMGELNPDSLTLDESCNLLALLKSFMERRGGVL